MQIEAPGHGPNPVPPPAFRPSALHARPSGPALADRGGALALAAASAAAAAEARWLTIARLGALRSGQAGVSVWIQLRGRTRIVAREGRFELRPGDWIVFERDSAPELVAERHGLTLGVLLPAGPGERRGDLLPGRGRMAAGDLRIALRLWRGGREAAARRDPAAARALAAMLRHLCAQQRGFEAGIARCPGRTLRRKRQVFARMQRAWLFLEGHCDRVVRLTELAELTSFSSWYLSKTFHGLYDESPQAASARLRLERACTLLAATDDAIGEIGAACGFDNSCSFARAFRARHRMTASAWREAAKGGEMPRDGEARR
jgi:AraC family transcriptional regulator